MKKEMRQKSVVYGFMIFAALILVLGVSYAWMQLVVVVVKKQTITTYNIYMIVQNETNEIHL